MWPVEFSLAHCFPVLAYRITKRRFFWEVGLIIADIKRFYSKKLKPAGKFKALWNLTLHWNLKFQVSALVRNSVEESLNALLDKEAHEWINAEKFECSSDCQGYPTSKIVNHTLCGVLPVKRTMKNNKFFFRQPMILADETISIFV